MGDVDILIPVLAAFVPLVLATVGARMSWMKDRPCMIWLYITVGVAGLCVIAWQGCRTQASRQREADNRRKVDAEAKEDRKRLEENQKTMKAEFSDLKKLWLSQIKQCPIDEIQQHEMIDVAVSAFARLEERINLGESVQEEVIRATPPTSADPRSPRSPKPDPSRPPP
jgi:hypothetical protein